MHPPARALGLPVASARGVWAVTGLVLLVYLFSQYRDLSVWDSALIALVAQQGGVGHPPGYPLHTWLGFLLARLPGVPLPLAIGWLSAIPGALLCVPVASLAWQFGPPRPHGGPSSPNAGFLPRHAPTLALGAVIAAMALHPAWWDPATRIEVYSLAAFLAVWALARLAASLDLRAPGTNPRSPRGRCCRWDWASAWRRRCIRWSRRWWQWRRCPGWPARSGAASCPCGHWGWRPPGRWPG